ncbi:cytosolic non-specific dipeptidase-like [Teleopsis dalmanni]|uniref:cytosolic non-specific dipeptidase-like n=1 Tax=Teleopsis dalmanni TaxID=139649 RepID=UPI0018CD2FCB|nr:cytosolic non-specific dipeptidase-like [Teleopsis dalmanni]
MHSGVYGGAVPNPINVLATMIGKLINEKGHITIPGFYDTILELNEDEKADLAKIPFDLGDYKKSIGIANIQGEEGFSTIERASIRPTLDVNGIWGGYTGEGAKTVIPSHAYAKISMRLVPGQDPDVVTQQFVDYFPTLAPDSVEVKIKPHHGGKPYILPTNHKGFQAAKKALAETFEKEALAERGGGLTFLSFCTFRRRITERNLLNGIRIKL